ncbi:MAG: DUF6659 family protein [Candidatus Nitrosotenuis sp.]|uniref:Uncharacterized protein n=1 Tax=Candidatus Nitrosotenuis uzonensis TaxID=1407055 RepID=V6ASX9_9ARCH|nr:DUF6659 family protein [Candidatus Nitrosotenuis uzonensis]CAE6497652.1 conserved hypothetical protein [Candidatus Nitrosotenuis uzonensis]CDI05826.1 conserved hypothetical protein [Candidatus Nitrosotenuis uzonensis]
MVSQEHQVICEKIFSISPYIRFVGIIGRNGKLRAYKRRQGLKPLLDAKHTQNQFVHIAKKKDMESKFDRKLGKVEFVWEERKKVQTISFAIKQNRVWVSIDKRVVRTEMLRIIDSCLPIVKLYS